MDKYLSEGIDANLPEEETEIVEQVKPKFTDSLYMDIIKTYLDTESVKLTAEELNTTSVKVRKVLITEGLWSSKTSLEIQHYLNLGKTTAEIADILSTTEKAVQQYLPYTKGLYNGDNPTVAAINSADYRERIRVAQEKTLKRNRNLAVENQWHEMYEVKETACTGEKIENGEIKIEDMERYSGDLRLPDGADFSKLYRGIDPIRLHLELVTNNGYVGLDTDDAEEYRRKKWERLSRVLKTYGEVKYGDTISRDIIVPGNMPLWALNYVIQRCFGWQNCHLHQFELPEEQFQKVINGETDKYMKLVGVAFRSPWMEEGEEFWNDDYEDGSIKTWLRKKYTGPYESLCYGEGIWQCKQDIKKMQKRFAYVEVEHWLRENGYEYYGYLKPISTEEYKKRLTEGPVEIHKNDKYGMPATMTKKVCQFSEIPMDAMKWISERPLNRLLERLSVEEVFALHDRGINDVMFKGDKVPESFEEFMDEDLQYDIETYQAVDTPNLQPIIGPLTDTLYFNYDFGDNWYVKITGSFGAADLVESGRITQKELEEAVLQLLTKYRPVCIAQDGLSVLDDVGGLDGFVQFLNGINQKGNRKVDTYDGWSSEYGSYGNKKESLEWAKSLGWSRRKVRI